MTATAARISYNLDEAAAAVGFSVKTLRRAIATGDLIAHRATGAKNSKHVVLADDLRAWIEAMPTATEQTA